MNPTSIYHWEFGGPLAGLPPDQAWLILLAMVGLCAVLAWLSYRFAVVVLSLPQRALLVALRTIFLGALLLCLANPVQIERKTAEPPPPPPAAPPAGPTGRLVVLVDRSDSMTTADNRGRTRLDDALATWRRFEPVARPIYAETQYFSFAGDLKPAASLAEAITRTGGTAETHLYESITAALKKPKEERPNAIVVLTDGVDTSGEPEAMVRDDALAAGVPVHFVAGTNRDRPEPFLRVREWSAPSVVLRDTEFVVETSFEAFSREDRTVPYSLWRGDLRIESDTLTLTTGPNLVPRSFRISAGKPGPLELSLKLGEGSDARVVARSETSVLPVRPITVLVFQGALDWGLRYFTDALRTDPSFELLTVVNPALGVVLARSAKPGGAVVGKLGDDAAKLQAVDCIVLARVYPQLLDDAQQKALVDFVRAGGTVLFTNPDPEAVAQFTGSRLAQLLPVVFDAADAAGAQKGDRKASRSRRGSGAAGSLTPFALTEAGLASPIFVQASAAGRTRLVPKFSEFVPVSRLRPGAEVLAVHPTARAPDTGQSYILLATQTFGRGHTAILTTDGLWRWKMSEPSDARVVETFWQQLLLAIGRRTEREHIHFVNMPAQVKVGEVVALRLAGVAADTTPVVVAKLPDGRGARITPTSTGDAAAPWRINWKPSQPGPWEFVAAVEGDVRTYFFTTAVTDPTGELARTPTAVDALRALAASTGGLLLADKLPFAWRTDTKSEQSTKAEPIVTETRHLLWNNWTLLWVALGAFSLELILRRLWKLL
jgi:hypothetical protein